MIRTARSVALVAALASAGCSAIVDPEAYDPLTSAEGFCNSIQDAIADLPCGFSEQFMEQEFGFLRSGCDTLQDAVDAHRFTYSSGSAAACIDAIERLGCRGLGVGAAAGMTSFQWPQPCRDAIRGAVQAGGACSYQEWGRSRQVPGDYTLSECAEGMGCYADPNFGDGFCGDYCAPPAGWGESCAGGRPCVEWLRCAYNSSYTCQYGTTGDPCMTWGECADGYYCSGGASGCQPLPSAGQPCYQSYYCNLDTYCSPASGLCEWRVGEGFDCSANPSNMCQLGLNCHFDGAYTCRYPAQAGQSCAGTPCDWTASPPLYCGQDQVCHPHPAVPLPRGGDCWNLGTAYCADGLFCDGSGAFGPYNTCQPQLGPGGDCSSGMGYELCRPDTWCNPNTYRCTLRGDVGASCDSMYWEACRIGLYCRTEGTSTIGVCDTAPTAGEPCSSGGAMMGCAPGHYQTWPPPNGYCVCAAIKGEGDSCSTDDECGYYDTGRRCDMYSFTCQHLNTCDVPIGWVPGGAT